MLVGPDEELTIGECDRSPYAFAAQRIPGNELKLRAGRQDDGLAGLVGHVQPAVGSHQRTPRLIAHAFLPQFLAGLQLETLGGAGVIDDVDVLAHDDRRADPLRDVLCPPPQVPLP